MGYTFTKESKREELEQFFCWCGEYAPYVRYLYVTLSKSRGEISVANELLERCKAGDWINLKCDAYELGYVG